MKAMVMLSAYAQGVFPMADPGRGGEIGFCRPDPRGILPLEQLHVPKSLRRTLRKGVFELRFGEDLEGILAGCADRYETWLSEELQRALVVLDGWGYVGSVGCYVDGELVGGLYGLMYGGIFFGESMFSRRTDASKVALCGLVERLRLCGFGLLDVQWSTPHLARFGVKEVSAQEFDQLFALAKNLEPLDFVTGEGEWTPMFGCAPPPMYRFF